MIERFTFLLLIVMKPLDELEKDLQDTLLLHGEKSEAVARVKGLIGIYHIDHEDLQRALIYLDDASGLCKALGIDHNEIGLDIDYRRAKIMELRAADDSGRDEAFSLLQEIAERRKAFDDNATENHRVASLDEALDSTLVYYDEALQIGAPDGDPSGAAALMDKCLVLRRKKFGQHSPALLNVMLDYADILRSTEHFSKAQTTLAEALEIAVKGFGRPHPRVAEVLNSMGNLHKVMCEYDAAEGMLMECLQIRKEILPENDIQIGSTLNNLAELKRDQERYIEAIAHHMEALSLLEQHAGADHPATVNAKGNYGVTLHRYALECQSKGDAYLAEAVDFLHHKKYDEDHPWIKKFGYEQLLATARRLTSEGEFDRSIALYTSLISQQETHLKQLVEDRELVKKGIEDALYQLQIERFEVMLKSTEKLIASNQFGAAFQQLRQCERYIAPPPSNDPTGLAALNASTVSSLDHVHLVHLDKSMQEFELYIEVLHLKARLYKLTAQYSETVFLLESIIKHINKRKGKDPQHKVGFMLLLVEVQFEMGLYKAAESGIALVLTQVEDNMDKDMRIVNRHTMANVLLLLRALLVVTNLRLLSNNFEVVIKYLDRIYALVQEHALVSHPLYVQYIQVTCSINRIYGIYDHLATSMATAINLQNNLSGREHLKYIDLTLEQALALIQRGAGLDALRYIDEAQQLLEKVFLNYEKMFEDESEDNSARIIRNLQSLDSNKAAFQFSRYQHPVYAKLYFVKARLYHLLYRLNESLEYNAKSEAIYRQLFGEEYNGLVANCVLSAEVYIYKAEWKKAIEQCTLATNIRDLYSMADGVTFDYDQLYLQFLTTATNVEKGNIYYVKQELEALLPKVAMIKKQFKGFGVLLLEAHVHYYYGRLLLHTRDYYKSRHFINQSGILYYDYYSKYNNIYILRSLLLAVECALFYNKFKDAKVLLSYIYSALYLLFSYQYANHPLFVETYLQAIDMMRMVGYYNDCMEMQASLQQIISVTYNHLTTQNLMTKLMQARLYKDRKKFSKAESVLKEIESAIILLYNEQSLYYIQYKMEVAEVYLNQEQVMEAEKTLTDTLLLVQRAHYNNQKADVDFLNKYFGDLYETTDVTALPLSIYEVRILCSYNHLKLFSNKPNVIQNAMNNLQKLFIPYLQFFFNREMDDIPVSSTQHLYMIFITGLHAMLSNKFKFNSGRKQLFEVFRCFDEFSFPIPFDHPFVLTLGGYEKSTSKDRLSKSVKEHLFYPWTINAHNLNHSHDHASILPKNIFIDLANHDPKLWSGVHFYGTEATLSDGAPTAEKRGRGKEKSGTRSRSPSPTNEKTGSKPVMTNATFDEALQAEQKARRAAEDEIVLLKHRVQDLIDQLQAEQDVTAKLTSELEVSIKKNLDFEDQVAKIQAAFGELTKKFNEADQQLKELQHIRKLEEEEKLRKEQEIMEQQAKEEEEKARSMDPKLVKQLEAAESMFKKANIYTIQGYYYHAMPLIEEGIEIRHRIWGKNHLLTLQSYLVKVDNLIAMGYYEAAKSLVEDMLIHVQTEMTKIVGYYPELEFEMTAVLYYLYYLEGYIGFYSQDLDALLKDLTLKVQNNTGSAENGQVVSKVDVSKLNTVLGRLFSFQAFIYMEQSRISEAKVTIDKSNAILYKEVGGLHAYTLDALHFKAMIYCYNSKFKEAMSFCEQRMIGIKVMLKAHLDEHGDVSTFVQLLKDIAEPPANTAPVGKRENVFHPSVAQTSLLMARCLLGLNSFTEAKNKLALCETIMNMYYKHGHIMLQELQYLQCEVMAAFGEYYKALDGHYMVIQEKEKGWKYILNNANYMNYQSVPVINKFSTSTGGSGVMIGIQDKIQFNIMSHTSFIESLYSLVIVYMKLGLYEKAAGYCNSIIKLKHYNSKIVFVYFARLMLLYIDVCMGKYVDVNLQIEQLLEEVKGNVSLQKEHNLYIYLNFYLGVSYHVVGNNLCERYLGKAIKYSKQAYTEHSILIDCYLYFVDIYMSSKNFNKALECLMITKSIVMNLYAASTMHEYHSLVKLYEGKVLLYALVNDVDINSIRSSEKVDKEADSATEIKGEVQVEKEADKATDVKCAELVDFNVPNDEEKMEDDARESAGEGEAGREQAEMVPIMKEVPVFDNRSFQIISDILEDGLLRISDTFQVTGLRQSSKVQELCNQHLLPPIFHYFQGLFAYIQLFEFTSIQAFIEALSTEEKQAYFTEQMNMVLESKQSKAKAAVTFEYNNFQSQNNGGMGGGSKLSKTQPDPPGLKLLQNSIKSLQSTYHLPALHVIVKELTDILNALMLQFNPLQIAQYNYQKALHYFAEGNYIYANKLFSYCISLYFNCFGYIEASKSYILAELLYYKAMTCFYLAYSMPFVSNLYMLSLRIYKLHMTSVDGQDVGDKFDLFMSNIYIGLSFLHTQQMLYDSAFNLHFNLDVMLYSEKTKTDLSNVDVQLFAIRLKVLLAQDYIAMFQFDKAQIANQDALRLLKDMRHVHDLPPPRNSLSATNENIQALLAELLISVYLNEVILLDYFGSFKLAEEYFSQVDNILASWENPVEKDSKPELRRTNSQGSIFSQVVSTHPHDDVSSVASVVSSHQTHAITQTHSKPKEVYEPAELGRLMQCKARYLHVKAEHMLLLTKMNEVEGLVNASLAIKYSLFNIHYGENLMHVVSGGKKGAKGGASVCGAGGGGKYSADYVWSVEKEEEVNAACMQTLETLFTNNHATEVEIDPVDKKEEEKAEKKDKATGELLDDIIEAGNKEVMQDYASLISAFSDNSDNQSVSNMSLQDAFDIHSKSYVFNRILTYGEQKFTPHFVLTESFMLLVKLYMARSELPRCKGCLELVQSSLAILLPQHKKTHIYALYVSFYIAEYKFLTNHTKDSLDMHNFVLENRLSFYTSTSQSNWHLCDSYFAICRLYLVYNNYEEAMIYINKSLGIMREIFRYEKEDHFYIQYLLVFCAGILFHKGYYQDAQVLIDKIITHLRNVFNDLHTFLGHAYLQKATILTEMDKYQESISVLNSAKNIYNILLPKDGYEIGLVYHNLARNYSLMNQHYICKQHLDMSIVIVRRYMGKYHLHTLLVLLDIAVNFYDMGKYNIAMHILERNMYLLKKYLNADNTYIARGNYYLGLLHMAIGSPIEKIMGFFNSALYIYRKIYSTDRHIDVCTILVQIYYLQGMDYKSDNHHFDMIVHHFDNLLATMKLIFNTPYHIHIAYATYYLANLYYLYNKLFDANTMFGKVADMMKHIYASNNTTSNTEHILMYMAFAGQGRISYQLGSFEACKSLIERCVMNYKELLHPSHPQIATVLTLLGQIYLAMGKYNLCKDVLLEANNIRQRALASVNPTHPDLSETLLVLAEYCQVMGLYENLAEKRRKELERKRKLQKTKKSKSKRILEDTDENEKDGEEVDGDRPDTPGVNRTDAPSNNHMEESGEALDDSMLKSSLAIIGPNLDNPSSAENVGTVTLLLPSTVTPVLAEVLDDTKPDESAPDLAEAKDDIISVPSVMISAIEHMDDNQSVSSFKEKEMSIQEAEFNSTNLLQKASFIYSAYLQSNLNHYFMFNTKHLQAELLKYVGKLEDALDLHEEIFQQRRKYLGDTHLDTIRSLLAIADTLRLLKRVYPNVNRYTHTDAAHKHSKLQSGQAGDESNLKDLAKMGGTVTLQDHLLALAKPLPMGSATTKPLTLDEQKLLTDLHPEMHGKKKKTLPLPKGYMGYSFPTNKNTMSRPATANELLAVFNTSQVGGGTPGSTMVKPLNNPLHDPKKCLDTAMSLLRKVLNKDDPIHSNTNNIIINKKEMAKMEIDHPMIAMVLYYRSEVYRIKGDYVNALKYLEQCLTMRRKLYRSTHMYLSDCMLSMAMLLYYDQRYVQSLPLFNKSLEIRIFNFNSAHPSIAEIYNMMTLLYIKLGDLQQGKEYVEKAMAICTQMLGNDHVATGNVYINYAALMQALNKRDEALQYYKKALQSKLALHHGDNHPEVASLYNNIAILYRGLGQTEEALEHYEKALEIQKRILGASHPDVGTIMHNMGTLLASIPSRKYEAKEMYKAALNIRTDSVGKEHIQVSNTMNNYGLLLFELCEYKTAKELLLEAFNIRQKIFNGNNYNNMHPLLAESLSNLAYWEYHQGSLSESITLYEQALTMRKKIFQSNLIITNTCLQLSAAYYKQRNITKAMQYAEEAYSMRLDLLGELHADSLAAKKALEFLNEKLNALQNRKQLELMEKKAGGRAVLELGIGEGSLVIGEEAMENY
ncbi:MAG: tetratricopeptide repeat protein [Myxococcales bacterium]|nr:MAG: tetratricopeptide repeat protein [Myxococcales bacterium]